MVVWLGTIVGCTKFAAVPVTVKEVRDYVVGRQESFAYPLSMVKVAAVYNLEEIGFTIDRIEHFDDKGLIHATCSDTEVNLMMEAVTPKMTKVFSKIRRGESTREFSSEQEVYYQIRESLEMDKIYNWERLTKGLIKVRTEPDKRSPVIALVGPGARVDLIHEWGGWGKIKLMEDAVGYVPAEHLN
jgi:hypothetical protein